MNTRKPLKVTGIILIFCILIFGFVMVFSQVFFAHHIAYGNFMIYSTEEIDDHIYQILDSAGANLQASPFYYKALEQKIFFCNNPTVYTLFCYPARKTLKEKYCIQTSYVRDLDIDTYRPHSLLKYHTYTK